MGQMMAATPGDFERALTGLHESLAILQRRHHPADYRCRPADGGLIVAQLVNLQSAFKREGCIANPVDDASAKAPERLLSKLENLFAEVVRLQRQSQSSFR